jgi:hypothetical protein
MTGKPRNRPTVQFSERRSPVLFRGDSRTAFRDPTAIYHDGWFHLYCTYVRKERDGISYSRVAWSRSRDLRRWTPFKAFTPEDLDLNYGSPGDVIRFRDHWVLCLQTYPRSHGEKYGNKSSRIWTMRSNNP